MKYSYKNIIRYGDTLDLKGKDKEWYRQALFEYYYHLSKINFKNDLVILKYFGDSFFHDSYIESMIYDLKRKNFSLILNSIHIFQDINAYRNANGLKEIGYDEYLKNPVLIKCTFKYVSGFQCKVAFNEHYSIMDTEINNYDKKNGYGLTMSLWKEQEINFYCKNVRVEIPTGTVSYYTLNKRKTIPLNRIWKANLLTPKKINDFLQKRILPWE